MRFECCAASAAMMHEQFAVDLASLSEEHRAMVVRFSRHLRILPSLGSVNLSRSGISTSFGRHGAWLTVGRRSMWASIGLSARGIRFSPTTALHAASGTSRAARSSRLAVLLALAVLAALAFVIARLQP
jgi:hypothetical protein